MSTRTRSNWRKQPSRAGFTLLELTVALLVMALMAMMIIPRFGGTAKREFDLVVDQVSDLLTMFAQRQQLQQNPVGIRYDEGGHRLLLVLLEPDPDDVHGPARWRIDPYVNPVNLPGDPSTFVLDVYADGDYVDIKEWPLASTPAERRPAITVTMQGPEFSATLQLAAHAIVPQRSDGGGRVVAGERVDLDSAGRSREDW